MKKYKREIAVSIKLEDVWCWTLCCDGRAKQREKSCLLMFFLLTLKSGQLTKFLKRFFRLSNMN